MSNITVLTPAYNRGKLLEKLYESLCAQDCKDFEWLIVDDGSTDDTSERVEQMKQTADFPISYHKKENGGKHTALNYAYQFIKAPLTFIVDSDDSLTVDAISCVNEIYKKYKNESDLCGFSFLRGKPDGGYLSTSGVPQDGMKESYVECRINRNIGGDMAEVWYTHCLKEYLFPEFQGEKFLGEDIVWVRMSEKYKMRFFNRVIYISDYLEDGFLFEKYIKDFDYWGHCDCDLIFGNLEKNVTPLLNEDYDKLFAAGHLTIYKNTYENNRRFMKSYKGRVLYKEAFTTDKIFVFDEDCKVIHYCWFGGNPLPEEAKRCIESWKKYCPDYKIIEWNENNYDVNSNEYMKAAYKEKKWAFVSDYARIDVVYKYGGIYMDTDVELVKELDSFLNDRERKRCKQ